MDIGGSPSRHKTQGIRFIRWDHLQWHLPGLADTGAPRWQLPSKTATGPALADYIWAES